jgi:hypothetical protein
MLLRDFYVIRFRPMRCKKTWTLTDLVYNNGLYLQYQNWKQYVHETIRCICTNKISFVYNTCLIRKFLIGNDCYHLTLLCQYTTCLVGSATVWWTNLNHYELLLRVPLGLYLHFLPTKQENDIQLIRVWRPRMFLYPHVLFRSPTQLVYR